MRYLIFLSLFFVPLTAAPLEQAFQKYGEAERTQDIQTRKKLFNEALTLYLQVEPQNPSAKFCYNIANTYFQLGEYGYAILYYYKALKQNPRDLRIQHNLELALQKAGVAKTESISDIVKGFQSILSRNEKIVTALILFFVVFAAASLQIWLPNSFWYKRIAILCMLICLAIVFTIVWEDYFSPPEAVILRPTKVRVDAGLQYAAIPNAAAIPGTKLEVIGTTHQGAWLRVKLPTGIEGYIPKEYARLI